jgi:hypothetical protein
MPAERFTKKANTPKRKRQWEHVYQSVKKRGGSAGSAVRQANAVLKKGGK